jgi:hypothetical protein
MTKTTTLIVHVQNLAISNKNHKLHPRIECPIRMNNKDGLHDKVI